jgi:hypothetical protein
MKKTPWPTGLMATVALRWIARILSMLSIGLMLLFLVGEGLADPDASLADIKLTEWWLVIFFPPGVVIGMIVGWWREGTGGAITVVSLFLFYVSHAIVFGNLPGGLWFLIFSLPGFLFLGCWLLTRLIGREQPTTS